MKSKISGGAAVIILAIVVILIALVGYHYMSGGPDADVTEQNLKYYKGLGQKPPQGKNSGGGGAPQGQNTSR
jgi:hypothetical protein